MNKGSRLGSGCLHPSSSGSFFTMDDELITHLRSFTIRHTAHHRPVALVTSGGTAADLEVNAVRFLDNFSTGLRGACAVEQFLKRGYAVIHLKRIGSVAPFWRLVEDAVGGTGKIGFKSIGELFDCGGDVPVVDLDGDFDLQADCVTSNDVQNKENKSTDIWLYSTNSDASNHDLNGVYNPNSHTKSKKTYGELSLNPRLTHSHTLQSTIRSYNNIIQQGLLITVTFRTVDEYLQKLQICCGAINISGSLGLVYLTAAVSDFYIPYEKRAVHKIQSRDYGLKSSESSDNTARIGDDNTLTITLYPVPKVIPTLRKEWCQNAFVVSFKLETDSTILRDKATMAMKKNGVHLVIGNELKTRHEKVFILSRSLDEGIINGTHDIHSDNKVYKEFSLTEVTSTSMNTSQPGGHKVDELEDATIEHVVRHHFYYISTRLDSTQPNMSSVELFSRTTSEAEKQHQARLQVSFRKLQKEKFKSRMIELAWNVAGSAVGMVISYGIARLLQRRQQIS